MPSVDIIRRESHAATQDVFQPVLTQNGLITFSANLIQFKDTQWTVVMIKGHSLLCWERMKFKESDRFCGLNLIKCLEAGLELTLLP